MPMKKQQIFRKLYLKIWARRPTLERRNPWFQVSCVLVYLCACIPFSSWHTEADQYCSELHPTEDILDDDWEHVCKDEKKGCGCKSQREGACFDWFSQSHLKLWMSSSPVAISRLQPQSCLLPKTTQHNAIHLPLSLSSSPLFSCILPTTAYP